MIHGFTASRTLENGWEEKIRRELAVIRPSYVVTGACIGGDQMIATWFLETYPEIPQIIVVPDNMSRVDTAWLSSISGYQERVSVRKMAPGSSYRRRNLEIVELSDAVTGFPAFRESDPRSLRSGTWQTIRLAREAEKLRKVVILSD